MWLIAIYSESVIALLEDNTYRDIKKKKFITRRIPRAFIQSVVRLRRDCLYSHSTVDFMGLANLTNSRMPSSRTVLSYKSRMKVQISRVVYRELCRASVCSFCETAAA